MKSVLIFLFITAAFLCQCSSGEADVDLRDETNLLDTIFTTIRNKIDSYVGKETYGKNLLSFFDEMIKRVKKITLEDILKAVLNGNDLFNTLWKIILDSADVGYEGTPLGGKFIHTFLDKAKNKMSIIDLIHLMLGPYDELFTKVQASADEAGNELKVDPKVLSDFKRLMTALQDGLQADMTKQT